MSGTVVSELDRIGIGLQYFEDIQGLQNLLAHCEDILVAIREKEITASSLIVSYISGTLYMIRGDLQLRVGKIKHAVRFLQEAVNGFVRITAETPELGDLDFDYEVTRRLLLCQAFLFQAKALEAEKENNLKKSDECLVKTLDLLSKEIAFEKANLDMIHVSSTYIRYYEQLEYLHQLRAKMIVEEDSIKGRSEYYHAISALKKIQFAGGAENKEKIKEYQGKIFDITVSRLQKLADKFWTIGIKLMAKEDYDLASKRLTQGAEIYRGLLKIQKRSNFQLQELLFRAGAREGQATELMSQDKNLDASETFARAGEILTEIVALVKKMKTEQLIFQFQPQADYFDGMRIFCEGLFLFDSEEMKQALTAFKDAQRIFESSLESAKRTANDALIERCDSALAQVISYIDTVESLED